MLGELGIMLRIVLNIALLFSILFFPWLATIFLSIVAVSAQRNFYEIVGWGIFYDLLYGIASISILGFNFFFTIGALILLYAAEFLKAKTRFY